MYLSCMSSGSAVSSELAPAGAVPDAAPAADAVPEVSSEPAAAGAVSDMDGSTDSLDSSDDETLAPFDVRPGQSSEPEPEPGTGAEETSAFGEIDYTVEIANDFSMRFDRNQTVLDLKMAVCYDMRHLQPGA